MILREPQEVVLACIGAQITSLPGWLSCVMQVQNPRSDWQQQEKEKGHYTRRCSPSSRDAEDIMVNQDTYPSGVNNQGKCLYLEDVCEKHLFGQAKTGTLCQIVLRVVCTEPVDSV